MDEVDDTSLACLCRITAFREENVMGDVNLPEPQHLLTHKQTANKPAATQSNVYCYYTVDNICSCTLTSTFTHCCCYVGTS